MRKLPLALLALVFSGCATPAGTYPTFSSQQLEEPAGAPEGVDVNVEFGEGSYLVEVANQTDASVVFRWDLASFVSTDGTSGFLLPGTTRVLEVNQTPRSEPVPPGGRMQRQAVTVWEGEVADPTGINFDAECSDIIGRPIRLVLPVEADGEVFEYVASFEVEHVLMVRHRSGVVRKRECPGG